MTNNEHFFDKGSCVTIKTGLFSGRNGVVVKAIHEPGLPEPWRLTVETRCFDRSKIFLSLDGSHVEPAASKEGKA